jgi:hypothetical protein
MANEEHLTRLIEATARNDIPVWINWRRKQSYAMPDLSEANLSGTSPAFADPSGDNLINSGLSNADLRKAKMYGAQLIKADLREADLSCIES